VNSWVITAGVLLHGRTRAIPRATQATPTATMASSTMNAIAFEVVQALPDNESITLSMTDTHRPTATAACAAAAMNNMGVSLMERGDIPPGDACVPGTPSAERIPISLILPGTVNLSNVRALLIINPRATSMTGRDAGLVVRALGSRLELDTQQTQYRGHAGKLAAASATEGYDLVVTFSGDGTVNEVVNGLMRIPEPTERPAIAPIPGGSANVFARTLGLPPEAGQAVQRILAAVASGERRKIGLGLAGDRYFTFSAGLGLDAEVIADKKNKKKEKKKKKGK